VQQIEHHGSRVEEILTYIAVELLLPVRLNGPVTPHLVLLLQIVPIATLLAGKRLGIEGPRGFDGQFLDTLHRWLDVDVATFLQIRYDLGHILCLHETNVYRVLAHFRHIQQHRQTSDDGDQDKAGENHYNGPHIGRRVDHLLVEHGPHPLPGQLRVRNHLVLECLSCGYES